MKERRPIKVKFPLSLAPPRFDSWFRPWTQASNQGSRHNTTYSLIALLQIIMQQLHNFTLKFLICHTRPSIAIPMFLCLIILTLFLLPIYPSIGTKLLNKPWSLVWFHRVKSIQLEKFLEHSFGIREKWHNWL